MACPILRSRLQANIASALADTRVAGGVEHAGSKGTLREMAVQRLLQPLLRPDLAITSGFAIDSTGLQSRQLDVIVHSNRVLPPIMAEGNMSCVPIEACLHIFEIKSLLTRAELVKCVESALLIRRMKVLLPEPADGQEFLIPSERLPVRIPTIYSILAFASDLTGQQKDERDRLREVLQAVAPDEPSTVLVHDLCVVGSGYWKDPSFSDHFQPATLEHDELIAQLVVASDSWPMWAATRGSVRLGPYIR